MLIMKWLIRSWWKINEPIMSSNWIIKGSLMALIILFSVIYLPQGYYSSSSTSQLNTPNWINYLYTHSSQRPQLSILDAITSPPAVDSNSTKDHAFSSNTLVHNISTSYEGSSSSPTSDRTPDVEPKRLINNNYTAIAATNKACVSKWQHLLYRNPHTLFDPPSNLTKALLAYEQMHARCTSFINSTRSWRETFYRPPQSAGDGDDRCKYLVFVEGMAGLGNRLLSLASAFVYALLTDRALLIDNRGHLPQLLCEPFGSSTSWRLPKDFPMWEMEYSSPSLGQAVSEGFNSSRVLITLRHERNDGDLKFYCSNVQEKVDRVPWVGWNSNQYVVPRFFTMPRFWQRMRNLFDPTIALSATHLSRYLFLPNNEVWQRIVRMHWAYFPCSSRKVSIQVRLHARQDTAEFYPPAFSQIMRCLIGYHILPNVTHDSTLTQSNFDDKLSEHLFLARSKAEAMACNMTTAVMVASLQVRYYEELKSLYMNGPTEDGSFVRVHMASHDGSEQFCYNQSLYAFTEIWLLSMGDELATSSWSTFGYVGQALGARTPYLMNIRGGFDNEGLPPCSVGQSIDPCQHYPFLETETCDGENSASEEHRDWIGTHIRPCQDEGGGIQLVDPPSPVL